MVVFVVMLQDALRKIPVQYSKKIQGRKQVGGQSTYIPLKVNTAGVIPVIFAQSFYAVPCYHCKLSSERAMEIGSKILKGLVTVNWCNPKEPIFNRTCCIYIVDYCFAYFYTSITFNPLRLLNNMKVRWLYTGYQDLENRPAITYKDFKFHIIFIGALDLLL